MNSGYFCVQSTPYWILLSSIMLLGIFLIASSSAAIHANSKLPPTVRESNGFQIFMLLLGLVLTIFTVPYFIAVVYQVKLTDRKKHPDGPWKSYRDLIKDITGNVHVPVPLAGRYVNSDLLPYQHPP